MPTETLLVVSAIVLAFSTFATTIAYVDVSTRAVRRQNHPLPGE